MFSSKKTKDINLIPESEAAVNLGQTIFPLIIFGLIIVVTIAAGVFLFFLNTQEIAKANEQKDKIATQNAQWQKIASVTAQINQIKAKIAAYQGFANSYPPMENYIDKISSYLPVNVSLLSLDITNTGSVNLQAKAPTAASADQFVAVLNSESKVFSNVKILGVTRATTKDEYTISLTMMVAK